MIALQRLAESTEDPRAAIILFLLARGGAGQDSELQSFLKLKGRRDRLDVYLNDLLRARVLTRATDVAGRVLLLPAAGWDLIRRRHFGEETIQPLPFEAGLAEARAAVDAVGRESSRAVDQVGRESSRAAPPPLAANRTASPPVVAAPSVPLSVPISSVSGPSSNGNCQLQQLTVHQRTAKEALTGATERQAPLDAETIVAQLAAGAAKAGRGKEWGEFAGWFITVARNNPERIQRAWERLRRHPYPVARPERWMFSQISNMRKGLG